MRRLMTLVAAVVAVLAMTVPASAGPTPPGCWDVDGYAYGQGDGYDDGIFSEWGADWAYSTYAHVTNGNRTFEYSDWAWSGAMIDKGGQLEFFVEHFDIPHFGFSTLNRAAVHVSSPGEIWTLDGVGSAQGSVTGSIEFFGVFDIWGVRITTFEGTLCY